ncbi:MAG: 30S ribosomal protein S15 [Endomicrobiaceae bacterium]|jgi:small subunit ribosomal protein S15|nr:30S ribosomal protein S15 [Endomicrobiaceae bacterium]MDD3730486.1 30S ribosomal protein S15 [Endomicrobiaceae bacterium]MDD4166518.1 30S ribosomal protein S15 [Endomicrobiaceae bacterium]
MVLQKKEVVEKFKTHATDTGSPEVQIALLTTRINYLADHFKKFPKDFASRIGFLKMIGQRRSLLDYLKRTKKETYQEILKKLDLRK